MESWQSSGNLVRGKGRRPGHVPAAGAPRRLAERRSPELHRRNVRGLRNRKMIRTILMLIFWALAAPVAAIIGFSASFIIGAVRLLYRLFMWGAWSGVSITGVRAKTPARTRFARWRSHILITTHVPIRVPPIQIPLIPHRTSVMV